MRKIVLSVMISLLSHFSLAQELERKYKIELGLQGLSVGAELPVGNKFLVDAQLGWIGFNKLIYSYEWTESANRLFVKGQMRYYVNREERASKGHSLEKNSGSFLAFQSKYFFNGVNNDVPEKYWLNEFQFGQQLPLGSFLFFRYHVGVGLAIDFDSDYHKGYPSLGFAFGYSF